MAWKSLSCMAGRRLSLTRYSRLEVKSWPICKKINYYLCDLQVLWSLTPFLVSFITFSIYVTMLGNCPDCPERLCRSGTLQHFSIFFGYTTLSHKQPNEALPKQNSAFLQASISVITDMLLIKSLNPFLSSDE